MEKYKIMNDHNDGLNLCPRCKQGLIKDNRYCKNCGFDFESIDKNDSTCELSFGMEGLSNGEKIKENNKSTYSQKITKPIKFFNKVSNILFLLIGLLSILTIFLPLFSDGNFWSYYERISLGEGHYNFTINESLKISEKSNIISMIGPVFSYPENFDNIIGYSDIMFLYESLVIIVVALIVILGIILIIVGILSLFFNYNSRHHRILVGSILSLSMILIFALNCFGVAPILLAIVSALTLVYFYVVGVLTKEKKFMLKQLIHKTITMTFIFVLIIITSLEIVNLNVDIGASLFNSYNREELPVHIETCRGLFVEFMQFVQCTGGDDIFIDVTFKLNVICFILHFSYIVMLILSGVGLLMSLSKISMRFPIVKAIIATCLFYSFVFTLVIFNEIVNDAVFQQYVTLNENVQSGALSSEELDSLRKTYRIFVLRPGMFVAIFTNLPILIYSAIARSFCLKKTFY